MPTRFIPLLLLAFTVTLPISAFADITHDPQVKQFIADMVKKHGFQSETLNSDFQKITIDTKVLHWMNHPYEKMPWYRYQPRFVSDKRIKEGVEFWKAHRATLARAEKQFGVPASIIVALIGIESHYGRFTGKFSVLRSLATLSFAYPKRAAYFKRELEALLLLAREKHRSPLSFYGSYAGAIGQPQFMPSNYRRYAVDFSGKNSIDLQHNVDDIIGSVANYLQQKGWVRDGSIATKVQHDGNKTLKLTLKNGSQYWHYNHNFTVITRYNTSPLYAMAAFQLSQHIQAVYHHHEARIHRA